MHGEKNQTDGYIKTSQAIKRNTNDDAHVCAQCTKENHEQKKTVSLHVHTSKNEVT